jgi:hypothetical protein
MSHHTYPFSVSLSLFTDGAQEEFAPSLWINF